MRCDNHPDRGGILFVELPSIGVRRWGCFECRVAFDKSMLNAPMPRQKDMFGRIWEMHGGRSCTDSESAYHNPNAVYARAKGAKNE